ncbi:MAG: hypothetical protein HFJ52_01720 [Clostridia bacterium]|nr:hypothetical protein [Clostridia bacterium]
MYGKVKIVEKSTNEFYNINVEPTEVTVTWSKYGDTAVTIGNMEKRGYIEINKYDAKDNNIKIPNTVFGIFDKKTEQLIEELTTNEHGYAKSSALPLNRELYLKELKANDHYITNEEIYPVNLIRDGIIDQYVYTLNIPNSHKEGNLHVEKITADDKTIHLANVEFELYSVKNSDKKLVGKYYTDVNGEIYIENLNIGDYLLKETATNRWYYLGNDTPIEVKWSKEYGDTHVIIENEKKKGIIKVVKKDKDFNEYALEGIKFDVYDEDNNYIETIVTNNEGIAESSRLRIDKKYHVVESETLQNYVLDETIHTIDFTEGLTKDQINDIQSDTLKTLELKNQHKKGNLVVYKVDSLDNTIPVSGVTFELYAQNIDAPYTQGQLLGTYTTDLEGKIEITGLWTGEFYLKEISTNLWYKLNKDNIPLEIKANETTEITITNEPKQGYITLEKCDSEFNNIKIPNVTFDISDQYGNFIESITTNELGQATSSLLPIDREYLIKESITDNSYVLSDNVFRVNFTENKTEEDIEKITEDIQYHLVVENDSKVSSLQIIKIDADNHEYRIPDVTFEIFDETINKKFGETTTDKNGCAIINNLKVTHKYTVKEKITNYKYNLTDNQITGIVLTAEQINSITFENEKKKSQFKVTKVDADNHEYKLEGVVFEVLDSKMNLIETLITDENRRSHKLSSSMYR